MSLSKLHSVCLTLSYCIFFFFLLFQFVLIIFKERNGKILRCPRVSILPSSPFHSIQQVMSRILWFSFKKLCSWNQHLWSVQSLRRELWFVPLPWELNLRNGMIWWDTYERLRLLVLLVSLKDVFFFVRGRGNRFLRYKKVLTQASSQCNIKITSARAWFYCLVIFVVDPLLICSNIYIYIYIYKDMYIYMTNCRQYFFGLLSLIGAMLTL